VDHEQLFRIFLTQAKRDFETAQSVVSAGPPGNMMVHSLLNSVLFQCTRARRIARDAPDVVKSLGVNVDQFRDFMRDATNVRNVSEHWGDVLNPKKRKSHSHISRAGLTLSVDETSLIVIGPDEFYIGPLNVYDVYSFIVLTLEEIDKHQRS
jgi:hypothetical protein